MEVTWIAGVGAILLISFGLRLLRRDLAHACFTAAVHTSIGGVLLLLAPLLGPDTARFAREIGRTLVLLGAVHLGAALFFSVMLRRLGLPRLINEIGVLVAYVLLIGLMITHLGFNLGLILTSSAIATAAIGLAMQDVLSNLAGGVVLQFERALRPGQWVEVNGKNSRVVHVRMRHTEVETAEGDRILMPNSMLTRTPLTLIGIPRKRTVEFSMPYGHRPSEVLISVEEALRRSSIPGVAQDPAPKLLVRGYETTSVRYGVEFWSTTPATESTPVSGIYNLVFAALSRAGNAPRAITQQIEISRHGAAAHTKETNYSAMAEALRRSPILYPLETAGAMRLVSNAVLLHFATGEPLVRQGDPGSSMFLISRGVVEVLVSDIGGQRRSVAKLSAGDCFGEMSMLTGEPRSATVVALEEVECWQMDREDFADLLAEGPGLIERISKVVAERHAELEIARAEMDRNATDLLRTNLGRVILEKMKNWFVPETPPGGQDR